MRAGITLSGRRAAVLAAGALVLLLGLPGSAIANEPPVLVGEAFTIAEDEQLYRDVAGGVLANDSDPEGYELYVEQASDASHGDAGVGTSGDLVYYPDLNYHGSDAFTYRVWDGSTWSQPVTVSVTVTPVNDPPVVQPDSFYIKTMDGITGNVVTNDVDIDGDPLTVTLMDEPVWGTLTMSPDGRFKYVPFRPNTGGTRYVDVFSYRVSDGASTSGIDTVGLAIEPMPWEAPEIMIFPSALEATEAAITEGALRIDARVGTAATGKLAVRYRSGGATTGFSAAISAGRVKINKKLPARLRRARSGVVTLSYAGNAHTAPERVTLRVAPVAARLRHVASSIDATGRLRAAGTISKRARGAVRVRLSYVVNGAAKHVTFKAKVRGGAWKLRRTLPGAAALAGGQLAITYAGDKRAGIRGEQISKAVRP